MRSRRDFHLEVRYSANFQCMPLHLTLQLLSLLFPSAFPLCLFLPQTSWSSGLCAVLALCSLPGIFHISWLLLLEVEHQFGPRVQIEQLAICPCKYPDVQSCPVLMRWVRGETPGRSFRTCCCHLSTAGSVGGSNSLRS